MTNNTLKTEPNQHHEPTSYDELYGLCLKYPVHLKFGPDASTSIVDYGTVEVDTFSSDANDIPISVKLERTKQLQINLTKNSICQGDQCLVYKTMSSLTIRLLSDTVIFFH